MTNPMPPYSPAPAGFLPLDDVLELLRESGWRVSKTTLGRWRNRHKIATRLVGGKRYWDFSGVLVAQREEARKRDEEEEGEGPG